MEEATIVRETDDVPPTDMTVEEAAVDGGVGRKRVILTDVDEEDESVSKFWSVEDFVAKVSTDEFVNSWV